MYKCPLAGGCLMEVSGGGSCLCMVNREHFWKVMVAGEGGGGEGKIGQLSPIPTSLCWLRSYCAIKPLYISFQRISTLWAPTVVSEAWQRHIWCDRCTQHMSSWNALASEIPFLTNFRDKHDFLMTFKKLDIWRYKGNILSSSFFTN